MYSMVLMAALASGTDMPDCHRGRGGCSGGGGYGGCYGGGYGGCYGGGYGGGCYGGGYGRGMAWGGGYGGGYAWGSGYSPNYAWSGVQPWSNYAYSPAMTGYTSPVPGMAYNPTTGNSMTRLSFYAGPTTNREATLIVHLPTEATLTVDGDSTRSTSDTRTFVTPPLEPGKTYTYTLRGEVNRDGQKMKATRTVNVRAGELSEITLEFSPS
jgi:uncharacterized protein (TIGR03000 family)